MITIKRIIQDTAFDGETPIGRITTRDGVETVEFPEGGKWEPMAASKVDVLLALKGAGSADVQPSAPEAEARTVVAATGPAPE